MIDKKNVKAILSEQLSEEYNPRYVMVDVDTGEIVDDANGYGYKTIKGAYSAYTYKNRTKKEKSEYNKKQDNVKRFLKDHKSFKKTFEGCALDICMGKWGPNDKVDCNLVKKILNEMEIINLKDYEITPNDLFKYLIK